MNHFDNDAATWDDDPERQERARLVAQCIQTHLLLSPQMTMLEYGCGTGLLSFTLRPYLGRIFLADSSPGMIEVVQRKITASGAVTMTPLLLDLERDPLPRMRVDLICTLMTLHHVDDIGKILKRFHDMLNAPGWLAAADLDPEDGSFHGPDFHGHRGFERTWLAAQAGQAGFAGVRLETAASVTRKLEKGVRSYPVFLMTAEKKTGQ
jgi:SAM-dependent methyltransferase